MTEEAGPPIWVNKVLKVDGITGPQFILCDEFIFIEGGNKFDSIPSIIPVTIMASEGESPIITDGILSDDILVDDSDVKLKEILITQNPNKSTMAVFL